MEGNSAYIRETGKARADFNAQKGRGEVLKSFKTLSGDGVSTLPDFENELAVLSILDKYRERLPFEIPRVFEAGLLGESGAQEGTVAFIRMTKLPYSLSHIDVKRQTIQNKIRHARSAAKALAKLHGLQLSLSEKAALTCSPLAFNIRWLERHGKTVSDKRSIRRIVADLLKMEGEQVFLHNDFHHKNLFAKSYRGPITGVCDFCCAGLGVREIDFYPFLDGGVVEKAFLDSYERESKIRVNMQNVGTVRALKGFIQAYYKRNPAGRAPVANQ